MRAISGRLEADECGFFSDATDRVEAPEVFPLFGCDFDKSASLGIFFRFFCLILYFFVDNLPQLFYLAELHLFRKQFSCEKYVLNMVGWPSG